MSTIKGWKEIKAFAFMRRVLQSLIVIIQGDDLTESIEAPSSPFDGEVLWLGEFRFDESCRNFCRALVIERNGLLYPANHVGKLYGKADVRTFAPVLAFDEAQALATGHLPI